MIPDRAHITIHDSATVRDSPNHGYDFTSNGLAILQPISCTVTEERNGAYYCEMTHPIDDDEVWKHLNENNIISVPIMYHDTEKRQLFRIAIREVKHAGKRRTIYVRAYHIWYDLRARVVLEPNTTTQALNGWFAMYWLFESVYTQDGFIGKEWYPFNYNSDITKKVHYEWTKPMTIPDLMIGDDHSIAAMWEGEIYRDNFYFSINTQKEYSRSWLEPIRLGVNMLEITEHVDWSNYCNYAYAYDNFDLWKAVSFTTFGSAPGDIVKAQMFNYKVSDEAVLTEDMFRLFAELSQPAITYTIEFADIRANPEYKDFIDLQSYEVCDKVRIINERLNMDTVQQVIQKVYDVLHRRTVSMKLGRFQRSITRKSTMEDTAYESGEDVKAAQSAAQEAIRTMPGKKTDPGVAASPVIFGDAETNSAEGEYASAAGSNSTASGNSAHADSGGTAVGDHVNADTGGIVGNIYDTDGNLYESRESKSSARGTINGGEACFAAAGGTVVMSAGVPSVESAAVAGGVVNAGKHSAALAGAETFGDNAFAAGLGCRAYKNSACLGVAGEAGSDFYEDKIVFAIGDGDYDEETGTVTRTHNLLELRKSGMLLINGVAVYSP